MLEAAGSCRDRDRPSESTYDQVPYVSRAHAQTSPSRLAASARLMGLEPPQVETARVLEIGCAGGGNIVPLAARHPCMRLLGFDLVERHVAEGQARIAALGLGNIEIVRGDVTRIDLPDGAFDYVIAHGIFSWVPEPVRAAILALTKRCLSPRGVAYVSYNSYPGWHLRGLVRALILSHDDDRAPLPQRIAAARHLIAALAATTRAGPGYSAVLRDEAERLAGVDDGYVHGEFLSPVNQPFLFSEFAAAARLAGLAFLAEAALHASRPETLGPEAERLVRTLSACEPDRLQDAIDFVAGRSFRGSLLVHQAIACRIDPTIPAVRLRGLHIASKLDLSEAESRPGRWVFTSPRGPSAITLDETVRAALATLATVYPDTRTVDELVTELREAGHDVTAEMEHDVLHVLREMTVAGIATVSTVSVRAGDAGSLCPRAWRVARADALAGRPVTAGLDHRSCELSPLDRLLLPLLDGTRGRDALTEVLALDERSAREVETGPASARLDAALSRYAEAALLEPG